MSDPKSPSNPNPTGNVMWGGRFAAKPGDLMLAINASIDIDQRMWREDIAGSKAHAAMLAAQAIISPEDNTAIQAGLDQIATEIEAGRFTFSRELEDIHFNIESALTTRIGEAGKRLHTGRSRNDQIATDFKLWVRSAVQESTKTLELLQRALLKRADQHADWVMPGFTHLQTAQPITLGHHLLAYVEMLERDRDRMKSALERITRDSPLGAAALAGTSFPLDREKTAKALGFARPAGNSLDAVSARDFALEALSALSISAVHLSRLAEEIVLWTSPQFAFARLADEWSSGSSIMPQKRNPDAAELIRAKAARISAALNALLGVMKGLPLTYSKDMQEDKAITFAAFDDFHLCVAAMTGMIATISFDREALKAAAGRGFSTATDLADWLVYAAGAPFREAHHITGAIVKKAEALGITDLSLVPLAEAQAIDARITQAALSLLTVEQSVQSRASFGGTAPARVREQIAFWKTHFGTETL